MPASFVRLRIAGFKSFAEPTVIDLLPGLTGIVGPNGCGKSNVVEALRWAMGENSARSLRGGEMDDVIFAGTAHRPRRDLAEVTLWLADTEGLAPSPFDREPELQVSRRIAREAGSTYRVNGREARARDIQTLFADLATGARASAMVSQGRVAAVVAASPAERRTILEEAAGITGLHARRHEAELKLRATEANLERAGDGRIRLASQIEGLRTQARQAARHHVLVEAVACAERELAAIGVSLARHALVAAEGSLLLARQAVTDAAAAGAAARTQADAASASVPGLRAAEADARTTLERARIGAEQAAAEAAEIDRLLAAARARASQVARDLGHAQALARDAAAATTRFDAEAASLAEADAAHPALLAAATADADAASTALTGAETAAQAATELSAELVAGHRAATDGLAAAETRSLQAAARAAMLAREVAHARGELIDPERLATAELTLQSATSRMHAAGAAAEAADHTRHDTQRALASSRAAAAEAEATRARLAAAASGVAEALAASAASGGPGVVDALDVPPGLEAALAAAFGEDLDSAIDPGRPRHWAALPPADVAPLPPGAAAITEHVAGPPALRRALSRIGLIEAFSPELLAALQPGQTLVSRDGGAWRWDGHTVRPGTPRAAAVRLQQRNRLASLRAELALAATRATAAIATRATDEVADHAAIAAEQAARAERRDADQAADRARTQAQALASRHAAATARLVALDDQAASAAATATEAAQAVRHARTSLATIGDPAAARAEMERARHAAAAARGHDQAAASRLRALIRSAVTRAERARGLVAEGHDWRRRAADAALRVADLAARADEAQAELSIREAAPAHAAARRDAATTARAAAEAAHTAATAALAVMERDATATERAARAAEAILAGARETAARAETALEAARRTWDAVPQADAELAEPPVADEAAQERVRRRLDRLRREREELGPVNLRAALEADAIATEIAMIDRETAELTTVIAKLRGQIGHINREGRERLGQIFADIDRHFRALFERMFGGGRAHLAMVGSDDPLLAGLEIYAQPPGKKLASLSLLSGGEQALAALSLIFAVFRCQPAPVCVLDEVDAPLDDANVGRFCALLDEMVRDTGTRFLVVTHHQLTMARMDRLYGVTMQERGVSRLLSVDLARATAMIEPARMAAE